MAVTEAQKRATAKYNKENYVRIALNAKSEFKEEIEKRAKELNMSIQGYITQTIKKEIENSKKDLENA